MPGVVNAPIPAPVAGPSKSAAAYKARTGFAPTSFRTLDREKAFTNPSPDGHKYTAPQELVAPHIHSFDALFEGAPLENGQVSQTEGLLKMGVDDLLPKVVFDHKEDQSLGPRGNRLQSESRVGPQSFAGSLTVACVVQCASWRSRWAARWGCTRARTRGNGASTRQR